MKKFFKGFLSVILTVWLMILLTLFGLIMSFKGILTGTVDKIVKEEIKSNIGDAIQEIKRESNENIPNDLIEKIEDTIDNNTEIKNLMDTYMDRVVNILLDDDNSEIDISIDLNNIIDSGEAILKEYDIVITPKDKDKIMNEISTDGVNRLLNDTIKETKEEMDPEVKEALNIYRTLTSKMSKVILVSLILITLLLITLLKGNFYKWLSNLATSSIIVGVLFGSLMPLLIDILNKDMSSEERIDISLDSLQLYGYVLIGLGILAIIVEIVVSLIKKKNKD